jgi:hypothetical protein
MKSLNRWCDIPISLIVESTSEIGDYNIQLEPQVHRLVLRCRDHRSQPLTATLQVAFARPHRDTFRQDYKFHNLDCRFSGGTTDGTSNVSSSQPTSSAEPQFAAKKVKP